MPKKLDIVGNTYGKLTVVESVGIRSTNNAQYVRCACSCGGEKVVRAATLVRGRTKSCGCLQTGPQMRLKKGEAAFNRLLGRYRRDAKRRGFSFDISPEGFRQITQETCHYCGVAPSSSTSGGMHNGDYIYNGIDRVDNSIGYVDGNIVPCCGSCNKAKSGMTQEKFLSWIDRLVQHRNSCTTAVDGV